MLKMFRINDGETHTIAACTEDEAKRVWKAAFYDYPEGEDDAKENFFEAIELPADEILRIHYDHEDSTNRPKPLVSIDGALYCIATVGEWLSVSKSGDFICSTLY